VSERPKTTDREYVAYEVHLKVLTHLTEGQFLAVIKEAIEDLGYGVVLSKSIEPAASP